MKKIMTVFVVGLFSAACAWAVPSFTPTLDGVKDAGWGNTPDHATTTQRLPTEFNLDGGLYITDDALNIYFGFDADPDPWTDGQNPHIHIVFDIGSTAVGGFQACWGANSVIYGFPFLPEWDLVTQWNTTDQVIQFTGLNQWNGSGWTQLPEITTDAGGGGSWTEIAIQKSLIGAPAPGTVLNVAMWLRPSWSTAGGVACLPADEDFPSDNGSLAGTFNSQFAYTVQTSLNDTDPPGIDHVHQISSNSLEIVFDEPMNQTTLNSVSNFTPTGWVITGIRYVSATTVGLWSSGFTAGNNYSIVVDPEVLDAAGNAMDPNDDEAAFTGVAYANVTVLAIDQSATHDQILFKGSFNFYSEHDPFWSGGSIPMWDDGTHGDETAGDHVFTLVKPLVPNGGTPNFEWGLEDESQNWLIVGPNPSFSLPNTDPLTVSYTIPDVTVQAVTLHLAVDMQFINAPITVMRVAGSFNGWTGTDMSDADADGVWELDMVIPAGSQPHHEYKFQRIEAEITDWEWISNRTVEIDDSNPTQDAGLAFFNNYLADPYAVTAYPIGTDVEIRWNNDYERVSFEVWAHTTPDDILINGTLVGTTATNHLTDDTSAPRMFYQVRTVYP